MLGMLRQFFSRREEASPTSSLSATRRFVSSLPLQDEYEAHHMIVNTLNLFNSSTDPLNQERLKVLLRLDESCQGLQDSLSRQYLKNQTALKHAEQVLWKEIFALYWHLAHGYQAFVREIVSSKGEGELAESLPLVTTRAMHYFGMEIKWRYFHQEAVEPSMWRRLHKFYRIAETAGFVRARVELAQGGTTTCADEYLQILLLDLLNPTSLKTMEIEVIDQLLNGWSQQVALDSKPDSGSPTHYVNLAEGEGAVRIGSDVIQGEKLRYLNLNKVLEALGRTAKGLRNGGMPEKYGLPMDCHLYKCIELLDQVAILWQRGAGQRLLPRERLRRPVEVAYGLAALKSKLMAGIAMQDELQREPEYWALVNESDRGVGLKIDSPATDSPVEGDLIGIRTLGGNARWEVGVVRWVRSADEERFSVGVEKLSYSPRLVTMSAVPNTLSAPGIEAENGPVREALFLPRVDDRGMASSLVLPAEIFAARRLFDLTDSNVIYRIRLGSMMEQTDTWVRAKFDILGRRQA